MRAEYNSMPKIFQFQCGAIEGSPPILVLALSAAFQFQCGAIEGTKALVELLKQI